MDDRFVGSVMPGKDVCDVNGDRIGSVARVYREDVSVSAPQHDDIVEVKTGLFGLGERLYVPITAVEDATEGALFVGRPAGAFDRAWHERPEYLDHLH